MERAGEMGREAKRKTEGETGRTERHIYRENVYNVANIIVFLYKHRRLAPTELNINKTIFLITQKLIGTHTTIDKRTLMTLSYREQRTRSK